MSTAAGVSIQPSFRVQRSEAIIFTEFDDAVVMMDAEEGSYYELDSVGARIWAATESGPRVTEICEALAAAYEVARDVCSDEVRAFLEEMCRSGVMRVLPGNDAIEIGKDGTRDPEAFPISGSRRPCGLEGGTKIAWITPTLRTIRGVGIRSAPDPGPYREPFYTS